MGKKDHEVEVVQFFLDLSNQKRSTDYVATPVAREDSEIDCFGKSIDVASPQLKFQVSTAEGMVIRTAMLNSRLYEEGLGMRTCTVNHRWWIEDVIRKKSLAYPDVLKKDLILLIEGSVPTPSQVELERDLQKIPSGGFKGVYVVCLPVCAYPKRDETVNGLIYVIKDAFCI